MVDVVNDLVRDDPEAYINLGNGLPSVGDFAGARQEYGAALRAHRDLDDQWGLSFLLEDVAALASRTGQHERAHVELLGAAESLRQTIGAPRSPGLVTELDEQTRVARETIGAQAAEAGTASGRGLDLDAAVEMALALCQDATGPVGA